MSSWRGSLSGWFTNQSAGKLALLAAIVATLLGWGALLFGSVDPNPNLADSAGDVIPDLVAVVDVASSVDDEWLAVARDDLGRIPGVNTTSVDWLAGDLTAFHLGLDDAAVERRSLAGIVDDIQSSVSGAAGVSADDVDVSGRLAEENELWSSYSPVVTLLAVLAVAVGVALAVQIHWLVGALTMVALAGSTVLAPAVAGQLVGSYDGTLASTAMVASLAALVTGCVVCWRLYAWFQSPSGDDGAEMIQRSVTSCCSDVALAAGALVSLGVVLAVFGLITHPVWSVAAGVLLALVLCSALMSTGLTVGELSGLTNGARDLTAPARTSLDGLRTIPMTPTVVLASAALLTLLSVFAFGQPGLQLASLDVGDDSGAADSLFDLGAGNPTEGLVVTLDESVSASIDDVAATVVPLTSVAWVDTVGQRHIGADVQPAVDGVGLLTPSVLRRASGPPSDLDRSAVIVPAVPLASEAGAVLLDDVRSFDGLSVSSPALADLTTRGSGRLILVVAVLFALLAGLAGYARSSDRTYAVTAAVLSLLLGSAAVGLYRIVAGTVSAGELLTVLVLSMTVVLLWILGFAQSPEVAVKRPEVDASSESAEPRALDLLPGDGVVVATAILILGTVLAAMAAFFDSGPGTGRFGTGMALVTSVTALFGMVILGPALLGQGAVFHRLLRPFRSALHPDRPSMTVSASLGERNVRSRWTDVATELMDADFRIQGDPDAHKEEEVALLGTPIFDEVRLRQARMRQAGLKVAGDGPVVRRVDLVRDGRCPSISLTVDHPQRTLIAEGGNVVGVRRPERKSMVVWLAADADGRFVIAELVETGTFPLEFVDVTEPRSAAQVLDLTEASDKPTVGDTAL